MTQKPLYELNREELHNQKRLLKGALLGFALLGFFMTGLNIWLLLYTHADTALIAASAALIAGVLPLWSSLNRVNAELKARPPKI